MDSITLRERAAEIALKAVQARFDLNNTQGFESRIFNLGKKVLKVPNLMFLRGVDSNTEIRVREDELTRLRHYAPLANARMLGLDTQGEEVPVNRSAVIAIELERGAPLCSAENLALSDVEAVALAGRLGRDLASRHRRARAADAVLVQENVKIIFLRAIAILSAEARCDFSNSDLSRLLAQTDGILNAAVGVSLRVRMGHGDPTLANVVFINNSLQWIDPGAGPLRVIAADHALGDEGLWDVGALMQSVHATLGPAAARAVVSAYAKHFGTQQPALYRAGLAWSIVWVAASTAVAARNAAEFALLGKATSVAMLIESAASTIPALLEELSLCAGRPTCRT